MNKNTGPAISSTAERRIQYISKATKPEIYAALKLVELLCLQRKIPKHVYRNICNEYYGKGIDKIPEECYTIHTSRDAV